MTLHPLSLYLERLLGDESLEQAVQQFLPVTLTPAVRELDGTGYRPQGEPLTVENFLHLFRPAGEPGSLIRHSSAVVIAPVGAGKSMLLTAIAWELAQKATKEATAPLPFYLPMERLGERIETLLMNALWSVGLPVARSTLRELVRESTRPLFFLIDPSAAFGESGAATALDGIIQEMEEEWSECRWIVAVRPETADDLPAVWNNRRFYLLDPVSPENALELLLEGLERPLRLMIEKALEQVPALATLVRRPLFARLLREVAQRLPNEDVRQWVMELILGMVEQHGGSTLPRAQLLETLQGIARKSEGGVLNEEARRLASKSLPRLQEAGLLTEVASKNGAAPAIRFTDPALQELLLWLTDGNVEGEPARREEAPVMAARGLPRHTPDTLVTDWEEALASHNLDTLLSLQSQLDQMQAETFHQIALTHRDASRLDEARDYAMHALRLQANYPPYLVTLGTISALAGDHDAARHTLEEALPHAPSGSGYFYLGQSYEALGWEMEAFQAYQQAARLDSPQQAEAAAGAARLSPREASKLEYWEQALALQPARADWHVQLGLLQQTRGEKAKAQASYRRALEANPNEAEAHYRLGVLLLEEEEPSLALKHLQRATTARPREAEWFVALGQALEATGSAGTEKAYRHAVGLAPQASLPYAALGAFLRRSNRLDEAHAALRQSLALNGDQVDVLFEMGLLAEAMGDFPQALRSYHRAAQLDDNSPRVRSHLGAVHRQLGQVDEARHWLEEALALNPHFGPAYDELGQLAETVGEWEEAMQHYRAALREMPDDVQLRFRTAIMHLRLNNPAAAIPLLESTARALPESAEVHWYLAEAYRQKGRAAEALAAYRATTRLAPENVEHQLALADHARRMNRLDEAQRVVERAISLAEDAVDTHRLAAEVALDRNEPARALSALRRAIDLAPHDASLYRRIGAVYSQQKHYGEALDYLLQALDLAGDLPDLLAEIAALHERRGDLEQAIQKLDRAIRVEPQNTTYRLTRARLLAATDNTERARRDWEIILRVNPASGESHYGLGQLLAAEGDKRRALHHLTRAIVGDGINPEWILSHAELATNLGDNDIARESLERLIDDATVPGELRARAHYTLSRLVEGREAQTHVQRAISLLPGNAEYYVRLAMLQSQAGLVEVALENLDAAHALDPTDPTILEALAEHHEARGSMWDAIACYQRAACLAPDPARLLAEVARLQKVSDWREARATLEEAIALDGGYSVAHRELGALFLEVGNPEEAAPALRQALSLDPDDALALRLLGELLVSEERNEEAKMHLERAAELDPDQDRIHFLLGLLAFRSEQADVALEAWQRAAALAPQNGEYQRHLGEALMALGRSLEARHALERALDLNADDAASHYLLGRLAFEQTDYERAAIALRNAVARDPASATYRRALGEVWLVRGQYDAALSTLRAAHELDADDALTNYLMARAYAKIDRLDQAIERAESAAKLAPDEPDFATLLGDLRTQRGEWEAAATAYQQALEQRPDDSALHLAIGICERERGFLSSAADWLRQAIDRDPQLARAHHLLAQTQVDRLRPFMIADLINAEYPPADPEEHQLLIQEALESARRATALKPRQAAYQATLAQALLLAGQPDAALLALRQVQEASDQRAFFLTLAGLATLQRGDGARGRALFEQATRLRARDPLIWIGLASAAVKAGDREGALTATERAVALAPETPLFHYAIARLAEDDGDLPRARAEMETAVQQQGNVPEWYLRLGDLRARDGDFEEALAAYDMALQALSPRAAPLRKQTEADAHFRRGRVLARMDRITDALAEMEAAIDLHPERHEWHAELAEHLIAQNRFIEAQGWLRSAIGQAPDDPAYPLRLAEAQADGDDRGAAIETLRSSAARWPEHAPTRLLLGQLLASQNEIEAAQEVLQQAIDLVPDNAEVHVVLGEVLWRKGDVEEARQHFARAQALDPESVDAHIQMGRMLAHEGQADAAMESFHTALRIDRDSLQAHYLLGRLCHRIGHPNKAVVHLKHVVDASPDSHLAWAALAEVSEASNELELAYEYYTRANEVAGEEAQYYFQMGRLLKELRRYNEAIPVLRQAVKVDPENTEAYKLLAAVSAIAFFSGR